MKYYDEEEYHREKRAAKRSFWSGIVLFSIGTILSLVTLAEIERCRQKKDHKKL